MFSNYLVLILTRVFGFIRTHKKLILFCIYLYITYLTCPFLKNISKVYFYSSMMFVLDFIINFDISIISNMYCYTLKFVDYLVIFYNDIIINNNI